MQGPSENPAEVANAGRLMRRQQNLAQIEIPEDDVEISRDFLGKGGFGAVYIADYGGRNAAAKVVTYFISDTRNLHVFRYCFKPYVFYWRP